MSAESTHFSIIATPKNGPDPKVNYVNTGNDFRRGIHLREGNRSMKRVGAQKKIPSVREQDPCEHISI